jgi:quercetin dioxygenase-like cupin family protein
MAARKTEEGPKSIEPARAYRLEELVQFAMSSVVSRTLVDEDQGTLTVFAFDKGQTLSEHKTPFDAYAIMLDGEAELTIGGETVTADAGQIVRMPANVAHSVHAPEPFKMMLVMIRA